MNSSWCVEKETAQNGGKNKIGSKASLVVVSLFVHSTTYCPHRPSSISSMRFILALIYFLLHIGGTVADAVVDGSIIDDAHQQHNHTSPTINVRLEAAKYYLQSEVQHLFSQSVKISGYSNSEQSDKYKLRLLEEALNSELSFVRDEKAKRIDIDAQENIQTAAQSYGVLDTTTPILIPTTSSNDDSCGIVDGGNDNQTDSNDTSISPDNQALTTPKWIDWEFERIYHYFLCEEWAEDLTKPLYTPRMWDIIRDKYWQLGESTFNFSHGDEYDQPYYADFSEGMGRGVFASRHIKKGELVHDGTRDTVFFRDGVTWRKYVMSLGRRMSCDVLEWTWTQDVTGDGEYLLCLNLGDGAFFNSGGDKYSNIAPKTSTDLDFYALRDIEVDEELFYDYELYETHWSEFGL